MQQHEIQTVMEYQSQKGTEACTNPVALHFRTTWETLKTNQKPWFPSLAKLNQDLPGIDTYINLISYTNTLCGVENNYQLNPPAFQMKKLKYYGVQKIQRIIQGYSVGYKQNETKTLFYNSQLHLFLISYYLFITDAPLLMMGLHTNKPIIS